MSPYTYHRSSALLHFDARYWSPISILFWRADELCQNQCILGSIASHAYDTCRHHAQTWTFGIRDGRFQSYIYLVACCQTFRWCNFRRASSRSLVRLWACRASRTESVNSRCFHLRTSVSHSFLPSPNTCWTFSLIIPDPAKMEAKVTICLWNSKHMAAIPVTFDFLLHFWDDRTSVSRYTYRFLCTWLPSSFRSIWPKHCYSIGPSSD